MNNQSQPRSTNSEKSAVLNIDGQTFGFVPAVRDTLKDVLEDPVINSTFGGKDRKLSPAQSGLAASVVTKMQDKLIDLMQESHRRELGLVSGFTKLYSMPLFRREVAKHPNAGNKNDESLSRKSLFTWGNLLAAGGILIVAASLYYTKVTANYKEDDEFQRNKVEELEKELKALDDDNKSLTGDAARSDARATELQATVDRITGAGADANKKLQETIAILSSQLGETARNNSKGAEKTYEKLYKETQTKYDDLLNKYQQLLIDNADRANSASGASPTSH